jgi:hypothetical protein
MSPQDLQRQYPQYTELISDILGINRQLISYAHELQKIVSK